MIKMKERKWCYSFNEENFEGDFETRGDAIGEGTYYAKDAGVTIFYVGTTKDISLGVNVDSIIDQLSEDATEQAGEIADDYLRHVKTNDAIILEEKLNEVLRSWLSDFGYRPTFWTVDNVEKIDID